MINLQTYYLLNDADHLTHWLTTIDYEIKFSFLANKIGPIFPDFL